MLQDWDGDEKKYAKPETYRPYQAGEQSNSASCLAWAIWLLLVFIIIASCASVLIMFAGTM